MPIGRKSKELWPTIDLHYLPNDGPKLNRTFQAFEEYFASFGNSNLKRFRTLVGEEMRVIV